MITVLNKTPPGRDGGGTAGRNLQRDLFSGCTYFIKQLFNHRDSSFPSQSDFLQQESVFRLQDYRMLLSPLPQNIFTVESHLSRLNPQG